MLTDPHQVFKALLPSSGVTNVALRLLVHLKSPRQETGLCLVTLSQRCAVGSRRRTSIPQCRWGCRLLFRETRNEVLGRRDLRKTNMAGEVPKHDYKKTLNLPQTA